MAAAVARAHSMDCSSRAASSQAAITLMLNAASRKPRAALAWWLDQSGADYFDSAIRDTDSAFVEAYTLARLPVGRAYDVEIGVFYDEGPFNAAMLAALNARAKSLQLDS